MKRALIRFFILLISLLSATLAGSYYIYNEDAQQLKRSIQERELSRHQSSLHITQLQFDPILNGIHYLTYKVKELARSPISDAERKASLEATFTQVATARANYQEIRLINQDGDDVIHVYNPSTTAAYANPLAPAVPDNAQNNIKEATTDTDKHLRPFVQHALNSTPDRIYTSQFDLYQNDEFNAPIPVLRFISHFTINDKSWLLTVNYRGQDYLNQLIDLYKTDKQSDNAHPIDTWLINNEGQWLLGPDKQNQPTFMPTEHDPGIAEFNDGYAMLWADIRKKNSGQILIDDYLYTYTRFFSEPTHSSPQQLTLPFQGADLPWTLITRVNMHNAIIDQAYSQQRMYKFLIFTVLVMTLVAGAGVFAWHLYQALKTQKKLYTKVNDSALKYATVLQHAPDGLLTMDKHRRILTINDAAKHILSCDDDTEHLPKPMEQLIKNPQIRKQLNALVAQFCTFHNTNGDVIKCQLHIHTFKTHHIEVIATSTSYSSSSEILLNLRDVTDWIEREEKLKSMSWALEQSQDAILITDNKGIVEYVNPSFERYNKVMADSVIGTQSTALLKKSLPSAKELRSVQQQLRQGKVIQRVIAHRTPDSTVWYEEKTISPIVNHEGVISHYISTGKDITERVLSENHLHRVAHYDYLTELPNRMLLQSHLEQAIEAYTKHHHHIALLMLDIDHFKQINDSLGHETGDLVLQAIAKRLQDTLREHDFLARLGGNEFAILVTNAVTHDKIGALAHRLLGVLSTPLTINNSELYLTASLGIGLLPDDTDEVEHLSKNTEIALYQAKAEGRNRFCFYTREMGLETAKQVNLESSLRQSLGSADMSCITNRKSMRRHTIFVGWKPYYAGITIKGKSSPLWMSSRS